MNPLKKKTIHEKIKDLRSHKEVIKEVERDPEFKNLLDRARLRVAIARQIKQVREKAGLTQAELAEALKMSQPMLGRLESLKDKRLPSLELLFRIASVTKKKFVVDQPGLHLELAAR
jgi:DNA-binding XRE family transcriptional regulator